MLFHLLIYLLLATLTTAEELHPTRLLNSQQEKEDQKYLKDGLLVGFILLLIYTITAAVIQAKRVKGIHQSGVAILLGLATSFILYWANDFEDKSTFNFNQQIFFYFILPPIIFAAGYNLKRRRFFSNFGGIALFGFIGTIFTFFSIAGLNILINNFSQTTMQTYGPKVLNQPHGPWEWSSINLSMRQILLMSSLVCSSDTVAALTIVKYDEQPKLFSLIFGEGILNDAVSIILFKTVLLYTGQDQEFTTSTPFVILLRFLVLSLASVGIGIVIGLLCSFILKKFRFITHQPVHQTAAVFFFGFLSYMVSELLEQSGIISLLICGVVLAHYAWYNLSPQAKHGTSLAFQMIGFMCEAFIFAYLGLVFFSYLNKPWSFTLIALEIPIIALGRIVGTFGLLTIIRFVCCKKYFLACGELTFVWFAGLIRGAIAFGLVLRLTGENLDQTNVQVIVTTSLVLVIFTTIVFGSIMPCLSKCLLPKKKEGMRGSMKSSIKSNQQHVAFAGIGGDKPKKSKIGMLSQQMFQQAQDSRISIGSVHQPFLHPNMQRSNSTAPQRQKKGTVKYYWKKFDQGIMKPIFIHKFDEIDQKKDLEFMDGFMRSGNQWAQDFRKKGEIRHQTIKRRHSVISRSSEQDSQSDQEANLQTSQLVAESLKASGLKPFDANKTGKKNSISQGSHLIIPQDQKQQAEQQQLPPQKFEINEKSPSFGNDNNQRKEARALTARFNNNTSQQDDDNNGNEGEKQQVFCFSRNIRFLQIQLGIDNKIEPASPRFIKGFDGALTQPLIPNENDEL